MLYVFASVVADHHLVGDHERLYEALGADGPPVPVSVGRLLAGVLKDGGQVDRGGCAKLARCVAFSEVCERHGGKERELGRGNQNDIVIREDWFVCDRGRSGMFPFEPLQSLFYDPDATGGALTWYVLAHASFQPRTSLSCFLQSSWTKYQSIHLGLFSNLQYICIDIYLFFPL